MEIFMTRWAELERDAPEIAQSGKDLIYQFGPGLGFLATVRKDGGPRVHPICPIITSGGLYAFIIPSPKLYDLRRDRRYALHSFPPAENDDEFYVTGQAVEISDPDVRKTVQDAYQNEVSDEEVLFELMLERCLVARYLHRGEWPPTYSRWAASDWRLQHEGSTDE
jgi:hypothetical protein